MLRPQGLAGKALMNARSRATGWTVGALALAVAVPVVVSDASRLNLLILMLMAAQAGVAWNVLGGYAGQVARSGTPPSTASARTPRRCWH